ncbi:hypothetical protein BJ684DRAFT_20560 [Piptocephalis cylindrospora]|uniref:RRM domain-containing protein n=1 Tax=Piptocephalis cylindrospora TaxID=1907219 RepID=A0A4P9Y287_9FUNG|nr:hypothetical protein BJ684DRAFT_20560 [Piptocephalis cylindrospora]|eukprot:RKP12925.1 hypothetical protein BJ684DRAFT_20560 [Piptocephalis cylindrospora]
MPRTTLHVSGFPVYARARDLAGAFERYGYVCRCDIPPPRSSRSRPFAFVEYEDPRDAEDAYFKMKDRRVLGKYLDIQWARPDRKAPVRGRPRSRSPGKDRADQKDRADTRVDVVDGDEKMVDANGKEEEEEDADVVERHSARSRSHGSEIQRQGEKGLDPDPVARMQGEAVGGQIIGLDLEVPLDVGRMLDPDLRPHTGEEGGLGEGVQFIGEAVGPEALCIGEGIDPDREVRLLREGEIGLDREALFLPDERSDPDRVALLVVGRRSLPDGGDTLLDPPDMDEEGGVVDTGRVEEVVDVGGGGEKEDKITGDEGESMMVEEPEIQA